MHFISLSMYCLQLTLYLIKVSNMHLMKHGVFCRRNYSIKYKFIC